MKMKRKLLAKMAARASQSVQKRERERILKFFKKNQRLKLKLRGIRLCIKFRNRSSGFIPLLSSNKGASFLGVYFMGEDPSGGDENRTVIVKPSYDIVQYSLPSVDIRYHINVS